jgi:hypothetical protein
MVYIVDLKGSAPTVHNIPRIPGHSGERAAAAHTPRVSLFSYQKGAKLAAERGKFGVRR